ncbi:MAG: thiol-disulfide oxidoreductase DCC family protein [Solirubrobacterales bacterium]
MPRPRGIVLYSHTCGFCRWSMAKLLAWDRPGRLRPVALQDPEAERLLPGMNEEERMASWHLITPEGELLSGGEAVPALLRQLPAGRPLAGLAARAPRLVDRAYRFVADHRGTVSRRVSEGAKERAERRIQSCA